MNSCMEWNQRTYSTDQPKDNMKIYSHITYLPISNCPPLIWTMWKKKAAVCCRSVTAAIQFGNKKTISSLYNIWRHADEGPINRQFSNIVRSLPSANGPFGYVVDHKICHRVYTLLSSLKYLYFCNLERSKSIVESICTFTSLRARCWPKISDRISPKTFCSMPDRTNQRHFA